MAVDFDWYGVDVDDDADNEDCVAIAVVLV